MINKQIITRNIGILAATIIVCFAGYYYYIKSINLLNTSDKLIASIYEDTGVTISIENLNVIPFPYPKFKLSRISTDNGIFIDSAILKFDFLSFFTNSYKISSIDINNLYTNPKKTRLDQISYHAAIRKISSLKSDIPKITILKIWDTAITNRILASKIICQKNNRDVKFQFSLLNKIIFKDYVKFDVSRNEWNSVIDISNQNFNLNAQIKFDENSSTGGELNVDIKNLANLSRDISPYFDFIINKNIGSSESVTLTGKITNTDQYVILDQISIKSSNILANGVFWIAQKDSDVNTIELKFDKLDIAGLYAGRASQFLAHDHDAIFKLDASRLRFLVKADDIRISGDALKNFHLDSIGDGSSFKILSCSGEIASGGDFDISGEISHNKYRPKFTGNIIINHNNVNEWISKTSLASLASNEPSRLYFSSNLIATPIDFKMENFKMTLGAENLFGSVNLKLIGNESELIGSINIDQLDLDTSTAPVMKNIYQYIKSLGYGVSSQQYNAKFIPLRTFPLKNILDININELLVEGNQVDRVSMLVSYEAGQLKIDDFLINISKDNFIRGNGKITATTLKPQMKFNITDGEISLDSISPQQINNFLLYAKSNLDLSGIDFSSQGFVKKIQFRNLDIEDFAWESSVQDGILNFPNLNFSSSKIGKNNCSGNIVFSPLRVNFIYGIDPVDLNKTFTAILSESLPFSSGLASFNGQLSTTGASTAELVYNLYVKGDFIAKQVQLTDLGVDNLIHKLSTSKIDLASAGSLFTDAMSTGNTNFNEIQGGYELSNGILSIKDTVFISPLFSGAAGIAINIYDNTMDLNSVFSFYPIGARIYEPKNVPPIKLTLVAKGNLFSPDKLLQFVDLNDINRIRLFLRTQNYESKNPRFNVQDSF